MQIILPRELIKTALIVCSAGMVSLVASAAVANQATPTHSPAPVSPQAQPTPAPQPSPNASDRATPQQSRPNDDRVYLEDIYPEYCRSYFHQQDWVSSFEYREGMYRCRYGNDH